jgi:hypothetical protein
MCNEELVQVKCRIGNVIKKLLNKICTGKKACVLQRRDGCREGLQKACLCVDSQGIDVASLTANGPAV